MKFSVGDQVFADGQRVSAPTGFGRVAGECAARHVVVELVDGRGEYRYFERDLQRIAFESPRIDITHKIVGCDGSVTFEHYPAPVKP